MKAEIRAIFADDNEELNAQPEELRKYPEIKYIKVSDGNLAVNTETDELYRPEKEKNIVQEVLDRAYMNNFQEYMYRIESGITPRQLNDILKTCTKHKCSHVYLDHDLTLTCHHGLLDEKELKQIYQQYVTDDQHFRYFIVYFFGSYKRYECIRTFLVQLGEQNIKRIILTKQPCTKTIKAFMKLCRLDHLFDDFISSIKRKKEKLEIISHEIQKNRPKNTEKNRSPRRNRSPKKKQ